MKKAKKGITLLEILIVLSIILIVAIATGTFFISNYRFLNETSREIELQRQGEKIVNSIVKEAIGSKGIKEAEDINGGTNISHLKNLNIKKILFETIDESYNDSDVEFKVIEEEGIKKLYLKKEEIISLVGENIDYIKISSDSFLGDSKGIYIEVHLISGQGSNTAKKIVKSEVNFRNK